MTAESDSRPLPAGAAPASIAPAFIVQAGLIMAMLVLGGGSIAGPFPYLLAQLAGIGLFAVVAPKVEWRTLLRDDPAAALLWAGLLLLIVAQLIPLPASVWPRLPGRAIHAAGDLLMFGQAQPRPLSLDPGETLAGLVFLLPTLAVWLLARRDAGFAERFVVLFLAFLLASFVLALAQLAAGPGQLRLYPTTHEDLPTGFFANRNHQAIAMICGIPMAAALRRSHRRYGGLFANRWAMVVVTTVCVFGALLTGSRTGAALLPASLLASLVILLAVGDGPRRITRRQTLLVAIGAMTLVGVPVVAIAAAKPGGALARVFSRSFAADDPRYAFWPVVTGMIRDSFPWGIGFGNFRYAFEAASTPDVLRVLYINHAHNDWLEYALEAGLPGLLLALTLLLWLAVRWRKAWRGLDADRRAPLGVAAGVVLLLLLAHSALDYPLRTIALSAWAGFCAGVLSPAGGVSARHIGAKRMVFGLAALAIAGIAGNDVARYTALRAGRTDLADTIPAPGSRLLAMKALKLAEAHAPFGEVATAATRAVALSPLAEPAFTAAGLASPDAEQAAALLDHAWLLSRRNPVLLQAQFQLARRSGHAPRAFAAADALYRLQLATPEVWRQLAGDLLRPEFQAEAGRMLAEEAPWRDQFLSAMAAQPADRPALRQLVEHMQHTARPPGRSDLAPAIATLALGNSPDPHLAWQLWQILFPGSDPLAWQPATAQPPLPFDWTIGDNARTGEVNGTRRLEFEGEAGPGVPLATKRLPLVSGRYRVEIAASGADARLGVGCGATRSLLRNGETLEWGGTCALADIAVFGAGADGWIGSVRLVPVN